MFCASFVSLSPVRARSLAGCRLRRELLPPGPSSSTARELGNDWPVSTEEPALFSNALSRYKSPEKPVEVRFTSRSRSLARLSRAEKGPFRACAMLQGLSGSLARLLTVLGRSQMKVQPQTEATALVADLCDESKESRLSAEQLAPLVYNEMRGLARRYLYRESPGHSLQSVDVVHEAYLRLVDQKRVDWRGKTHFYAVGARMMRRVLVDHARAKKRLKRGGAWQRITLTDAPDRRALEVEELLALHEAMETLASIDERAAQIAEMRFFAGLTVKEVAHVLGISTTTVEGDWAHARAWLRQELSRGESS